jgi:methionine synthase I (cobalamin-dependent)
MVTMAFADEPDSYEGLSPGECVRRLADAGVEITGVNCLRSPEHILPIMEEMRSAAPDSVHLATQPVAFHGPQAHPNFTALPEFPFELEKISLPRTAFGDFAVKARDLGFSYIGSCCGAVACHVREMARALGKVPAREREWHSPTGRPMSGLELHQPEDR